MATESDSVRPATNLAEVPETVLQKRYGLTRAELNAVKNALAPPGTTDYEVLLYVGVCNRLHLDPFVPGLVHFMQFQKSDKSGYRMGIVLGIYGYIALAQQDKNFNGFVVKSYPEDHDKPVTHATCVVHRKDWSLPLEVTVTFKEKRRNTGPWNDSPRQMTENAAIRRGLRLAYPTLFASTDDEDADDLLPAVNGRVGTVLGEHHEPVDAEAKVLPAADPAAVAPNLAAPAAAARPEPVAAAPASRPAPAAPLVIHSRGEVEGVAKEIAELMDDPALDRDAKAKMWDLLKERLDARNLSTTWTAQPEDYEYLVALRNDLAQYHRTA